MSTARTYMRHAGGGMRCMTAPCSQMTSTIAVRRATGELHEVAKANQIIALNTMPDEGPYQ
jgi:hypothetical protein